MEKREEPQSSNHGQLPTSTTTDSGPVAEQQETDATPPDGGYGWICTACTFTINCFTWGMVSVINPTPSSDFNICQVLKSPDLHTRHMACT